MKVAIIGAGISGLLSALELIEQGCSVTIFDQQQAGKAASWAGGGILSPMYPWRYPQAVNTLAQHGKARRGGLAQRALHLAGQQLAAGSADQRIQRAFAAIGQQIGRAHV